MTLGSDRLPLVSTTGGRGTDPDLEVGEGRLGNRVVVPGNDDELGCAVKTRLIAIISGGAAFVVGSIMASAGNSLSNPMITQVGGYMFFTGGMMAACAICNMICCQ